MTDDNSTQEKSVVIPIPGPFDGHISNTWPLFFIILPLIAAEAAVIFFLFHQNPLTWYLHNGAAIVFIYGLLSIGMDLDRHPDLISLNPAHYVGRTMQVVGSFVILASLRRPGKMFPEDSILGLPASLLLAYCAMIWLILIAPVQYFTFAIFGAPARYVLHSITGLAYDPQSDEIDWANAQFPASYSNTLGAVNLASKPVTATAAISAIGLEILARIVHIK